MSDIEERKIIIIDESDDIPLEVIIEFYNDIDVDAHTVH